METLKNTATSLIFTALLTFAISLIFGGLINLSIGSFEITISNAFIYLGVASIYSFASIFTQLTNNK